MITQHILKFMKSNTESPERVIAQDHRWLNKDDLFVRAWLILQLHYNVEVFAELLHVNFVERTGG
jgi:hypothetical protein